MCGKDSILDLIKDFTGPNEIELPDEIIRENEQNLVEFNNSEELNNSKTEENYEAYYLETER